MAVVTSPITDRSELGQAAKKASRLRTAGKARPGWWVYTTPTTDPFRGTWAEVTAVTLFTGPDQRPAVRLALREATGHRHDIEAPTWQSAQCCTATEARRAGLTTHPKEH